MIVIIIIYVVCVCVNSISYHRVWFGFYPRSTLDQWNAGIV